MCSTFRVIYTCDHCDSAFCALHTDSSDKTQLMYSTTLLYLFESKYGINASSRLKFSTASSNKFLSILIGESIARIKQRVISVAFKTQHF